MNILEPRRNPVFNIILILLIILIVLDKEFKWFGYENNVIKSNENCVKIECTHLNKRKNIT